MTRRLALLLTLSLAAPALSAEVEDRIRDLLGGDPAEYRRVIEGFQAAGRAGDGAAAAAFVAFPIEVTIDGARRSSPDPAAFAADFSRIVTPEIAAAVASQPFGAMFVRDQGVMLRSGEVWVAQVCAAACADGELRVVTIQSGP